jgi:hypothetical protein
MRGVELAARDALAAMGLPLSPQTAQAQKAARQRQMVVFDIDETVLSNVLRDPAAFTKGRRLMGAADLAALRDGAAAAAPPAATPALKPVLGLYQVRPVGARGCGSRWFWGIPLLARGGGTRARCEGACLDPRAGRSGVAAAGRAPSIAH